MKFGWIFVLILGIAMFTTGSADIDQGTEFKPGFQTGLERGTIRSIVLEVEYPDGTISKFEESVGQEYGGVLFDDGLIQVLLAETSDFGLLDWHEGISIWESKNSSWKERPSYLLLPKVLLQPVDTEMYITRAGCAKDGTCPAIKTGQCVGGGQCGK